MKVGDQVRLKTDVCTGFVDLKAGDVGKVTEYSGDEVHEWLVDFGKAAHCVSTDELEVVE